MRDDEMMRGGTEKAEKTNGRYTTEREKAGVETGSFGTRGEVIAKTTHQKGSIKDTP